MIWNKTSVVLAAAVPLALGTLAMAPSASGATRTSTTIVVTTTLDNTTKDGFCSLREAVQASNTHHAVDTCAAGIGTVTIQLPSGTIPLSSRLSLTSSVGLAGAGQSLSVIDGGSKTGLLGISKSITVSLQSLTLSHSLTAAVDNHGTVTMSLVRLTANKGSGGGGETHIAAAMENYGTVTLTGVTVDDNTGSHAGGPVAGIFGAVGSTTTLNDDDFLSNTASAPAPIVQIEGTLNAAGVQFSGNVSEYGVDVTTNTVDAILQSDGTMHASQLVFANNTGSAALETSGSATASLVSITGNVATGVFNTGTLTLAAASIVGNHSYHQYAGGVDNHGSLTLLQSTISGNGTTEVPYDGAGGIFNSGTATIANTTIDGNFAGSFPDGFNNYPTVGGLYNEGTATLNNVTLTANGVVQDSDLAFASPDVGGIASEGGTLKIGNSIVAYNQADIPASGSQASCDGTLTSTGYNLVQTIDPGCTVGGTTTGDKTGDPKLGPLQYNNGLANTRLPLTGSPVIDAGSPATPGSSTPGACRSVDERSVPRPRGPRCDMGATER